ncbi:claudin-10-like [Xyrauchen texanus]|uniref:claudin-10-like n=1 Tax=Xyrauchen texanus TaxID=154827 RepID=UPI002242C21C|nr:claudin-10-like [Xyrauchen texanus]
MGQRTVVMYVEIGCFVSCLCGWILICSTLAIEFWIVSESSGVVLEAGDFYSNIWMDCVTDSAGVSDCKYFPSMMDLSVFLHVSRALVVISVIFGFWGAVLALIGMKCTKIGGSELANARVTFAAALTYMASGFCGMIVYSMWGDKVRTEFLDPYFLENKSELGAALFIGWGGSCLVICGSAVMCYFSGRESFKQRFTKKPRRPPTYMTARTRQTYMLPSLSRPTKVIIPPLYQSNREGRERRESRESRKSRGTRGTRESQSSKTSRTTLLPIDLTQR